MESLSNLIIQLEDNTELEETIIKQIENSTTEEINAEDDEGDTPLTLAVQYAFPKIVQELIIKGANIKHVPTDGKTVLQIALTQKLIKKKEIIKIANILIEYGADPNFITTKGNNALLTALLQDMPDVAANLVIKNVDVNHKNNKGETPLIVACNKDLDAIVDLLIEKRADVNVSELQGITPLIMAAKQQNSYLIDKLIKSGAKVNHRDIKGWNALDYFLKHRKYNTKQNYSDPGIKALINAGSLTEGGFRRTRRRNNKKRRQSRRHY